MYFTFVNPQNVSLGILRFRMLQTVAKRCRGAMRCACSWRVTWYDLITSHSWLTTICDGTHEGYFTVYVWNMKDIDRSKQHCNTLQRTHRCTATPAERSNALECAATHCNAQHRSATLCNALQQHGTCVSVDTNTGNINKKNRLLTWMKQPSLDVTMRDMTHEH